MLFNILLTYGKQNINFIRTVKNIITNSMIEQVYKVWYNVKKKK